MRNISKLKIGKSYYEAKVERKGKSIFFEVTRTVSYGLTFSLERTCFSFPANRKAFHK